MCANTGYSNFYPPRYNSLRVKALRMCKGILSFSHASIHCFALISEKEIRRIIVTIPCEYRIDHRDQSTLENAGGRLEAASRKILLTKSPKGRTFSIQQSPGQSRSSRHFQPSSLPLCNTLFCAERAEADSLRTKLPLQVMAPMLSLSLSLSLSSF